MIYLDSSVALAQLLAEDRRPDAAMWNQPVVASRLLEYEVWTRLNNRGLQRAEEEAARGLLGRVAMLELIPEVIERARARLPVRVRTLDALHLASARFLIDEGVDLQLATYDERMRAAARKLKIKLYPGL